MIDMKRTITVNVKLFTGIDKDTKIDNYDRNQGLTIEVPKGTRLKKVVKMIGLTDRYALVCFINGQQVGLRQKLEEGDKIACLRPAAGG